MTILVTGTAGFIGSHVALRLLGEGVDVVGIDNLNPYYDVALKKARLSRLLAQPGYQHIEGDLADRALVETLFRSGRFRRVIHLAAQAGVRYASENPHSYIESNIQGFLNILEGCRHSGIEHLVFASTSSVYGGSSRLPFQESDHTEHPLSLYAATKKANEMMAHSYAHLYRLPCTGLRFFTVYGPWGRPDMAYYQFADAIMANKPIRVFNHGRHSRDFTYIADIVDGVVRVLNTVPQPDATWDGLDPSRSNAPYRLYNIGNKTRVELGHFIDVLERCLGRNTPAAREMLPLQPGDVADTHADVDALMRDTGYQPSMAVEDGLKIFADWYLDYHRGGRP